MANGSTAWPTMAAISDRGGRPWLAVANVWPTMAGHGWPCPKFGRPWLAMANAWPTMAGYGWPSLYGLSLLCTGYRLNNGLSLYGRAIALRARSWVCCRPWLAMTKVWPTMAGHYSSAGLANFLFPRMTDAQLLQIDSIRKVVGTRLRGLPGSMDFFILWNQRLPHDLMLVPFHRHPWLYFERFHDLSC